MRRLFFILLSAIIIGLVSAVYFRPARHEGVFYPMGGIPFRVIEYGRSGAQFRADIDAAQKRVEELENVYSSHRPESEISRINRVARGEAVEMSRDLARVMERSKFWWEKTDGAFDVTVGPLIGLWRDAAEKGILPGKSEIENTKKHIGMDKLYWRARNDFSVQIDLGGIAKGDIVDEVANLLIARGVKRGVVDAGGDILAFGDGAFSFGIQDPTVRGTIIGSIEVPAGAVVTSGNYERFAEMEGKKYSHIIDPKKGIPVENDLVSVTVVGESCIDADALATALMVMGRERAIALLRREAAFKAVLIEKKGDEWTVWIDAGLKPNVNLKGDWQQRLELFE